MEQPARILQEKLKKDQKFNLKYKILEKIGSGSFGSVFKAMNISTKNHVALKIQFNDSISYQWKNSTLANEIKILNLFKGTQGVAQIYNSGRWKYGIYIEMELLTSSLDDYRKKQFAYSQIKAIIMQLLQIMRKIHAKGVIHQDLKPQNIMKNSQGNLVLIDFGLSAVIDEKNEIKDEMVGFIGTPRYASLAAHRGVVQTSKDDIESLLYVIGSLFLKKAPWFQLKGPVSNRLQIIQKYKKLTNKDWFKKCGKQFLQTYQHLEQLKPNQEPNYGLLANLFKYRQTLLIPAKTIDIIAKTRRMSDITNFNLLLPFTQAQEAKLDSPVNMNQNYLIDDKISGSFSDNNFSQIPQNGLEMMQLITGSLFTSDNQEKDYDLQNLQEQVVNQCNPSQLHFKNPFLMN